MIRKSIREPNKRDQIHKVVRLINGARSMLYCRGHQVGMMIPSLRAPLLKLSNAAGRSEVITRDRLVIGFVPVGLVSLL